MVPHAGLFLGVRPAVRIYVLTLGSNRRCAFPMRASSPFTFFNTVLSNYIPLLWHKGIFFRVSYKGELH